MSSFQLRESHHVVTQVHQANLGFGPEKTDGPDELPAHGVFLVTENMFNAP
jgi:hypothetical protein